LASAPRRVALSGSPGNRKSKATRRVGLLDAYVLGQRLSNGPHYLIHQRRKELARCYAPGFLSELWTQ
jgi:hypothetical protein